MVYGKDTPLLRAHSHPPRYPNAYPFEMKHVRDSGGIEMGPTRGRKSVNHVRTSDPLKRSSPAAIHSSLQEHTENVPTNMSP